jgi:hypothetical protein
MPLMFERFNIPDVASKFKLDCWYWMLIILQECMIQ